MNVDFETLSAFADGELDSQTRWQVEAALRTNPDLQRQLHDIRALKESLGAMRATWAPAELVVRKRKAPLVGTALAAALAVLLVSATLAASWLDAGFLKAGLNAQIIAVHDDFVAVDNPLVSVVTSSLEADFFRQAGLQLIVDDVLTLDGQSIRHRGYGGPNGCRISVFALPSTSRSAAEAVAADPGILAAYWQNTSGTIVLIARSMDAERFAAIARAYRNLTSDEFAPTIASLDIPRTSCVA